MIEYLKNLFIGKYLGLMVRHGLTAFGGFLIAQKVAPPEVVEMFVKSGIEVFSGGLIIVVGLIASFLNKKVK